jgi:nucleoside 2-deoxyribosyltransferase
MGFLKGTKTYLAGPIEYDVAVDWRTDPIRILKEEFGVNVHDPNADDKQIMAQPLQDALDREDYEKVREIAKNFVKKDLSVVQRMDFIVAYVPQRVPTVGTVHEIVFSDGIKLPTLLVCPQGKKKAGKWYFGIIDHKHIFGSWEDLYTYLREVDRGEHKDNFRWAYIYGLI